MHFLLSGCSCALASCRRTEPSICLLPAVVYSRALLHHHRKPLPLHPAANKDTAISASYSQRVHLHAVRKRHVTTTERYFASQAKDHLGSAFFPPVLGSPFHRCSFVAHSWRPLPVPLWPRRKSSLSKG